MTRSKVSPDGRISERDVAAKLVIIMVGLPARGKSYITKKIQRYLSWQQHSTRIFNVGNRRRIAACRVSDLRNPPILGEGEGQLARPSVVPRVDAPSTIAEEVMTSFDLNSAESHSHSDERRNIDQTADFFDPKNQSGSQLREQLALDTLDELLEYLVHQGGAVGILDATNSTIHRREVLVKRIREKEPKLGILFMESICHDEHVGSGTSPSKRDIANRRQLLEANMRLKLSGPDYRDKDPVKSLVDFKKRVQAYQSAYEELGPYEESRDLQYIQVHPDSMNCVVP